MKTIVEEFAAMPGFIEQRTYKNESKMNSMFDFGRGHVQVKVQDLEEDFLQMV